MEFALTVINNVPYYYLLVYLLLHTDPLICTECGRNGAAKREVQVWSLHLQLLTYLTTMILVPTCYYLFIILFTVHYIHMLCIIKVAIRMLSQQPTRTAVTATRAHHRAQKTAVSRTRRLNSARAARMMTAVMTAPPETEWQEIRGGSPSHPNS